MTAAPPAAGQINHAARPPSPQNESMTHERRAGARAPLALQFTLPDGSPAVTRDIGPGGMYFLMPAGCSVDRWLSFEYEMPETGLRFSATGEVVRTEPGPAGSTGVAVAWHSPSLQVPD